MALELDLLTFPLPGMVGFMAQSVEAAGWDGVHLADTQNLAADVYVSLGQAAAVTERLQLATGVTNPVTRHPAVTASAIASVQAASSGRAVLGIGRGDSSLGHLGRPPAKVADFERYLSRVRGYLHGEEVDLGDGVASANRWIAESGQPPVPIDVAATGPRVTSVAARLGDRVTFAVGADPARLRDAIALVRSEREAAGLDPAGISVGVYVNTVAHPDPDPDRARAVVRGGTAAFAHFSGMAGAPSTDSPAPRSSRPWAATTTSPGTPPPRPTTQPPCQTTSSTDSRWRVRPTTASPGSRTWSRPGPSGSCSSPARVTPTRATSSPTWPSSPPRCCLASAEAGGRCRA